VLKMRVNDIEMYYEVKGRGKPLVLIMGLSGNLDWWGPEIVEDLAVHYTLLLFDNRGAGRTDAPEGDYSILQFAGDTVGLMDGLGIDRAHIFGVSMGGMIAQEIALSYPERVDKLVLGCTNCGHKHSVLASQEVLSHLLSPASASPEGLMKLLWPDDFIEANRDRIEEFMRRYYMAPIHPAAFMRQMGAIMGFDSYGRLGQINAPTLVITGDRDILVPPENSRILASHIPGAKLEVLEGCGHGFLAQLPEKVCNILKEFLG